MAWTNPTTQSTGTLITATIWNTDIVDNLTALRGGSLAITSQAAGDVIYASSSTQLGRVAIGTSGYVLTSNGSAPAWSNTPTLTGTNFTGVPISTGISGLGTGVATFLATPSSANLRSAMTDETGSGALVFATSPTLITPTLGAATATSLTVGGNVQPSSNDGGQLGVSGTAWSDLFLASGGVINFNAGDVTITHSSNTLTFAGAASGYVFNDGSINATRSMLVNHAGTDAYVEFQDAGTRTAIFGNTGAISGVAGAMVYAPATMPVNIYAGGSERARITSGGDLAIAATAKLYLDGVAGTGDTYITESAANQLDVIAGGSGGVRLTSGATSWSAISDERTKTSLTPFDNPVQMLSKLRTGTGSYLTEANTDRRRSFLIAQDVQGVLPEAVDEGADGMLSLRYVDMIPVLVAAIQQQQAEIDALKVQMKEKQ